MITDINDHPNYLKISEVWAFISVDKEGNEGLCGFVAGDKWIPMIGADPARIQTLMPIAHKISKSTGKTIKLIKLSHREDIQNV